MGNIIDISKINCWIVYMMPFSREEKKKSFVEEYQKHCIEELKIFGMGWNDVTNVGEDKERLRKEFIKYESLAEKDNTTGKEVLKKFIKRYKELNKENGAEVSELALKNFSKIKENDMIMIRIKTGEYYIGYVTEKAKYSDGKDKIWLEKKQDELNKGKEDDKKIEIESSGLSWCCKFKYKKYSENELPGELVGRMSQRHHQTIQLVNDIRIRLLMIKTFQEKNNEEMLKIPEVIPDNIPNVQLNKDNFTIALNYMDLEDLVYEYIIRENPEYKLLPSQCKISKVKYEFDLINKNNINDIITCQVKNKEKVLYNKYENDKENFKKIYLFSGINKYFEENNEENIEKVNKQKDKIEIILKKDLFNILKHSFIGKKILKNKCYEIDKENTDNLRQFEEIEKRGITGWKEHKKNDRWKNRYKKYEDGTIEFENIRTYI